MIEVITVCDVSAEMFIPAGTVLKVEKFQRALPGYIVMYGGFLGCWLSDKVVRVL